MRNWDDLRFFLTVANHSSLARAGRALRVNKSTVFRRVAALEGELGARLVEVRGRAYVLTDEGHRLRERVSRLAGDIVSAEREVLGRDTQLAGEVTFATSAALAQSVLAPHLTSFARSYPDVRLSVLTANRPLHLSAGEADVALRHGARPDDPSLIAKRLCGVAGALYASRGYLASRPRPADKKELRQHLFVGVDEELASLPAAKLLAQLAPAENIVVRCSDLGAQAAMVEAGLGIAVLPCFVGSRRPELVRLFPPEAALAGALWLIRHQDLRQTARVQALVDHLSKGLRAERAVFEG